MRITAPGLFTLGVFCCCFNTVAQVTVRTGSQGVSSDAQQKNLEEYIRLLRTNVRQHKSEIMGSMMALDVDEAAKFWPIYAEYDKELTQLNYLRAANIQDYTRSYAALTDARADELMQKAFEYRKQRADLVAKYYERVKESLGGVQAARFLQIENQLLELIDLQIESSLPVASEGGGIGNAQRTR